MEYKLPGTMAAQSTTLVLVTDLTIFHLDTEHEGERHSHYDEDDADPGQ